MTERLKTELAPQIYRACGLITERKDAFCIKPNSPTITEVCNELDISRNVFEEVAKRMKIAYYTMPDCEFIIC